MLLTQKPQPINLGRHHRRHPASLSNIAVVSHPIPGLLTLTKPQKPQRLPSRLPPRSQSPRFPQRSRTHRPNTLDLTYTTPNADLVRGRPPAPVPPRRSPSQLLLHNTTIQPVSLPFPPVPSQQIPQDSTPDPPTIASQPSGRLAHSRRTRHKSTPAAELNPLERTPSPVKRPQPSAPIAVPGNRRATSPLTHKILSRSDPPSKLPFPADLAPSPKGPTRKDRRRRNKVKAALDGGLLPLAEWDYPAPSDDDADDDTDDREPTTPIGRTGSNDKDWQRALFDDGPKTAPIHSGAVAHARAAGQFPLFHFPPRAQTPAPRLVPAQTTPQSSRKLFQSPEHRGAPSPSPPNRSSARRESMDGIARQLFASSSFQIAPEPVELPKPSFLLA